MPVDGAPRAVPRQAAYVREENPDIRWTWGTKQALGSQVIKPQPGARAIMVLIANANDPASGITFGGLTVPQIANWDIYGRDIFAHFLDDISGRASDIVVASGLGNSLWCIATLAAPRAISTANVQGPSSWTGYGNGTQISRTINDNLTGAANKMGVFVVGGDCEANGYQTLVPEYGSRLLATGGKASSADGGGAFLVSNGGRWRGPDEDAIVTGCSFNGSTAARYHGGFILQYQ